MNNTPTSPQGYEPVSPIDMTHEPRQQPSTGFSSVDEVKSADAITRSVRTNSTSSTTPSMGSNTRRTRFAEATSVFSPATGPGEHESPFSDSNATPTRQHHNNVPQPSDVGFGYIDSSQPVEQHATLRPDMNNGAIGGGLKSALKTPGTASRLLNPLSPTFREEAMLEKQEEKTDREQARDLKIKTRVRMAKMLLRGVNFSCSLIVLAMLSTVLTIFHATRTLPPRNNLHAWSPKTPVWPQIVVLSIACVSLVFSVIVIAAYCRGGHRRAEKVAVYYTMFAVGWFMFSVIMWLVGAGILHGSKTNSNGQDLWAWSCKDNKRSEYFKDDVHYALVCRLQDWSLICCIIEVVVEIIVIAIYAIVFYRFYTKNRLRKSMDARDRARSDLYLAQLKSHSAPNTPGYQHTPKGSHFPSPSTPRTPGFPTTATGSATTQYAATTPQSATTQSPFRLQAPPIRVHHATPKPENDTDGFEIVNMTNSPPAQDERRNDHIDAAPGEVQYESVPIPGAYAMHSNR